MKLFIALFMTAFTAVSLFAESIPERRWDVRNESAIIINGESNVNNFTCKVQGYYSADDLELFYNQGKKYTFSNNQILIDLRQFDCGNAILTRDFQQTLQIDDYPVIIISFMSLNKLPGDSRGVDFVDGVVRITMAGVTKETVIPFSVKSSQNGATLFSGQHTFSFSDFKLKPPSKFMGMIRVKNHLSVNFSLHFRELTLK